MLTNIMEEENKKETNEEYLDDAEEIVVDDTDSVGISEKIKSLRDKLKKCEEEKRDYLLGWQRSKADFVNAKREFDEERQKILTYAETGLIEDIIPVLDSFFAARRNETAWLSVAPQWRMGVEYIEQQLVTTLTTRGLAFIEPKKGDEFDHDFHEAVSEATGQKGKIVELQARGYKLKNKVLRPAKVVVGI